MEEVFGGAQAYIWSATERTPGPTAYFGIIVGGIGGGIGGELVRPWRNSKQPLKSRSSMILSYDPFLLASGVGRQVHRGR